MITSILGLLILLILFIAFLLIMLSPLETLSWYAGWLRDDNPEDAIETMEQIIANQRKNNSAYNQYVIFLTGIGGYAQDSFLPEERRFMDMLDNATPDVKLVDDVYPYASTERGLLDGRRFSRFWRFAVRKKAERSIISFVINLRNLMQVMVAADPRYGLIYSRGITNVLVRALYRHGYPFGSGLPITLIGYSGGGEIAVSAIELLHNLTSAPIRVISLGGVMSNDPAIAYVDHIYHIYGSKDAVQIIGPIIFPGRWPVAINSTWNKMRKEGKITKVRMGQIKHNGPGGYLDHETYIEDGRNLLQFSVDTVASLINGKHPVQTGGTYVPPSLQPEENDKS